MKQNYIDEKGNYHNELNLTLAQIYDSGVDFGRSVAKADFKAELEKIKTEIGRIETEEGGDFLERPAIDIIYEAQKIIDKEISKLKGENNGNS